MKKSVPIMILICLVFSIHCNRDNRDKSKDIDEIVLNPKDEVVNIEFTKEKRTLVTGIRYTRFFVYNEDVNDRMYIYVHGYDAEEEKKLVAKKYDSHLNFISEKAFPFGQGPGDVGEGTTFCQAGDHIYGPDNVTRRVNIFDKNLNFIKFVKILDPVISTIFTEGGDSFFAFHKKSVPEGFTYNFIHSTFPTLKKKVVNCSGTLWLWDKRKKMIIGLQPELSFFIKKERVYFLNASDYRLIMFDLNGNKLKQVRLNINKPIVPKEKKKEWLFEQLGKFGVDKCILVDKVQPASWAVPLEKGFAVIRRKDYSTNCQGMAEADYFDYQLNHIGKINIPCFYSIFGLRHSRMPQTYHYQDGYLYLIYEDEETEEFYLEKWKVEEKL